MFLFVKGLLARVTLCAGPRLSHLFEWLRFAAISVLMSLSTDLDLDLSQAEPGGLSTPPDEEASSESRSAVKGARVSLGESCLDRDMGGTNLNARKVAGRAKACPNDADKLILTSRPLKIGHK